MKPDESRRYKVVMKVSVLMTSYNQEKYIAAAIDSILLQEVSFDYEVVIGEDASTDRTREIVLEFEKKHPDKIRVLLRDAAAAERDRARGLGGKANFVNGIQSCRGEFVALLDGDDYWTDFHKLEKLVTFLESHPECSVGFHDAMVIFEDGSEAPHRLYPADQKEITTLAEMVSSGVFPVPCTVLFRNKIFGELPASFDQVANGDWMLFVLLAEHGSLGYLNEVMAAYRIHATGFWSRLNTDQRLQQHTKTYETINAHLKLKYDREITERIAALRRDLPRQHARSCLDQYHSLVKTGELKEGMRLLLEAIHSAPSEVFQPRRFIAVLKNGFIGIFQKT
jgi:glycosyltransferase involved in cell wall biosynthesis